MDFQLDEGTAHYQPWIDRRGGGVRLGVRRAPRPLRHRGAVHGVGPDERATAWLHTHGLARCGALELEIVGAPYAETLGDNPLFYLSNAETDRARVLARVELGTFVRLLERFGGSEGWGFLVTLGCATDLDDDVWTEQLWFEVHGVEGDEVDATLINEPYGVALRRGDHGRHRLAQLTDFRIYSPEGEFNPDRIGDLVLRHP